MRQRKRLHGNYEAGCQNNTLYSPLYLHFSIVQNVLLIPIPYPPSDNSFKFYYILLSILLQKFFNFRTDNLRTRIMPVGISPNVACQKYK